MPATKFYLRHADPSTASGNLPASAQNDGASNGWTLILNYTLWGSLSPTIGTTQTFSGGTNSTAATVRMHMRCFVTEPLAAQTISGTVTLNCAEWEDNLAMNWWANNVHMYVWRPSTNALVGHLRNMSTSAGGFGGLEPTAASSIQVSHITGIALSSLAVAAGDVIIAAIGSTYTQGMATLYNARIHYDGTTENTTENAVVTSHASYLQFSNTIYFSGDTVPSGPTSDGFMCTLGVGA